MEQRLRYFIADFIAGPDTRGQVITALKLILEDLEADQREDLKDAELELENE